MTDGTRSRSADLATLLGRVSVEELRAAWDASPALIGLTAGPDHVLVYQNRASQAIFGSGGVGRPMRVAYPQAGEQGVAPYDRAFTTGEVVEVAGHVVAVRDVTGAEVQLRYVVVPLRGTDGAIEGTILIGVDVTAEARAERAAVRAELLAEVSARVGSAKDAASGLEALCDLLVPDLGDFAAVWVVPEADEDDPSDPLPPQVQRVGPALSLVGPAPPPVPREEPSPWDAALRRGEAVVIPVTEQTRAAIGSDPASVGWLEATRAHSIVVAPLLVAGTLTGVLLLLAAGERPAFTDEDLPFLDDVIARAGAAIAQLRTQRRQRQVAEELQHALLPQDTVAVAGLQIGARYIAGAPEVEVGGDWWDVTERSDGLVAVGIGDVSGRGVSAAAVMGQLRVAMRTGGHALLSPCRVLELLDAQVAEATVPDRVGAPAPPRFATACYGLVDPARHVLRIANAGHLPLLVRGADAAVRRVELPTGTPLGLRFGDFEEVEVALRPGDVVAMFTDGLVESRVQDIDDGLDALAAAFAALGGHRDLGEVANRLIEAVGRRQGQGDDDVALLLFRVPGGS